jgi:uncharacterized protein YjbI with pentapeptide repeats
MKPQTYRLVAYTCILLAVAVGAGIGALVDQAEPYLVARYWGNYADLHGKSLAKAPLYKANLAIANLRGADLRGADLRSANLSCLVYFPGGAAGEEHGADLREADLRGADLRRAFLFGARLDRADLRRADLRDADLQETSLRGADLSAADLRGADLEDSDLTRARYDARTRWPADIDPKGHGAVRAR